MDDYVVDLEEDCLKEAVRICKEAKKEIKTKTPIRKTKKARKGGHYRNAYTVRKKNKRFNKGCTLWNKQYRLSHLLERNHNTSNQYGAKGRTRKNVTPFWKQTEESMTKKFYGAVKEIIKKRR